MRVFLAFWVSVINLSPGANVIKLFFLSLTLQTNQCDQKTLKISPKKVDKTIVKTKICQNIFIKAQFLIPKHLQQNPSEHLKYIQTNQILPLISSQNC